MTPEQEARAQRIASERHALRLAMSKIPFNLSTAGHTRVIAYKKALENAAKVMNRNPTKHEPYVEARLLIESTALASVEALANDAYGEKKKASK